jgi:hypothetical protein
MGVPTDVVDARRPLIMRILLRRFLYRHPKAWGSAYVAAGCVHVLLGIVLSAYRYGWGAGLIAVGGLELWAGHQLLTARVSVSRER